MSPTSLLSRALRGALFLILATMGMPRPASAQIFKKLKKAAQNAAESELVSQVDQAVRDKVRCVFDDLECIRNAEAQGQEAVLTDDSGQVLLDQEGQPVSDPDLGADLAGENRRTMLPGEGAWSNYDFQPGDSVLVFDDFTGDSVGDFPRRFELIEGNFEVVEWNGARYLRATSYGVLAIPLPGTLPDRFTLEFSASIQHGNGFVRVTPGRAFWGPARTYQGTAISVERGRAGYLPVSGGGPRILTKFESTRVTATVAPIRVMADGSHMKMYLGEVRVANAPNAVFPRGDTLFLAVGTASEQSPILIGPLRIAAGGRDLYDRLARDGRAATQGILFATNSARIRPESTPTLDEIATMLREHPALRIAIEGHTDSQGTAEFNQALSERRAAAVVAYLTGPMGIEPARLESAGFGESSPAASNDTPEGMQQNRRVELVRLGS